VAQKLVEEKKKNLLSQKKKLGESFRRLMSSHGPSSAYYTCPFVRSLHTFVIGQFAEEKRDRKIVVFFEFGNSQEIISHMGEHTECK
jgi:hypothetical protein